MLSINLLLIVNIILIIKLLSCASYKIDFIFDSNLYNIQLNYIDPKTGKEEQKFILPENPNGRILHLVYRLQDGLYEFKPLETQYVSLKQSPVKTKDGKALFMYKGSSFQKCKDHYGNPSFNIQPYLRKIKT
jgi:hypothetical protein